MKRIILRMSLFLLMVLLLCTVMSRTISRLMLPQISILQIQKDILKDSGDDTRRTLVPLSCVYADIGGEFIFVPEERATVIEKEIYVRQAYVVVTGRNNLYAAVKFVDREEMRVAAYPSKPLFNGAIVSTGPSR